MKRPPKSFVVEHKRRGRTAGGDPPSIWSGAIGSQMRDLVGAADEDAQEASATETARPAKPTFRPPTRAAGRILVAREVVVAPETDDHGETDEDAPVAPRRRGPGRPRRSVAVAGRAETEATPTFQEPVFRQPTSDKEEEAPSRFPQADASATTCAERPTPASGRYSERRRTMTKGLAFGERWKRGL